MTTRTPPTPLLPANLTDTVRIVWVTQTGDYRLRDLTPDLDTDDLFTAQPARRFPSWPGKRNYTGWYWNRTTSRHLPFESLLERQALTMLDFDPTVADLLTQPCALLWPRSASHHFPDILCKRTDGTIQLIDVRPEKRIDPRAADQFQQTRAAATHAGWTYTVYTGTPDPTWANVRFLAGYRHHRDTPAPTLADSLRDAFHPGAVLAAGIVEAADAAAVHPQHARQAALAMLWTHDLHANLDTAWLTDQTVLWS